MVERTYYYIQQETEPFRNLALERYLLENVPKHSCILYLWQNWAGSGRGVPALTRRAIKCPSPP